MMYNKIMNFSQKDIDVLDDICDKFGGELLFPPCLGKMNIHIKTSGIHDLTLVHDALFFEGFSFKSSFKRCENYIEILGIKNFENA